VVEKQTGSGNCEVALLNSQAKICVAEVVRATFALFSYNVQLVGNLI